MDRQAVEKMFTPVEARFLTETQKTMIVRTQRDFLDIATTIVADIPDCHYRTQALQKLFEVKMLCTQSITHVGYDATTKETKQHGNKAENKNQKTETQKEGTAHA